MTPDFRDPPDYQPDEEPGPDDDELWAEAAAEQERWQAEPVVTTPGFTPAEQAAWQVAVTRGLAITAADLRAILTAARAAASHD